MLGKALLVDWVVGDLAIDELCEDGGLHVAGVLLSGHLMWWVRVTCSITVLGHLDLLLLHLAVVSQRGGHSITHAC